MDAAPAVHSLAPSTGKCRPSLPGLRGLERMLSAYGLPSMCLPPELGSRSTYEVSASGAICSRYTRGPL